ncbi:MAG: hypothetical protein M0026_06790 [Nocardiopsaceae bacterium]|nr:hypothetical protein [Nocardiopsaceae bacterium]
MVDEVTIAIAAAVAGKAAESLTESAKEALKKLRRALRERFRGDRRAQGSLEAAQDDYDDAGQVRALAVQLAAAGDQDPQIRRLTDELRPHFATGDGGVVNTVEGDVSGTVIQARDIHGGIGIGG